jgi:acyl-CoA synthetase (AMP-forming)/AMP-acid ligase II
MEDQPSDPTTIGEAVRHAVEAFPNRVAVMDGDRRVTYARLGADVSQAGAALVAHDVERGDRVAIWAPNSYQWIVACLATGYIGAVVVPVNTRYRGAEALDILSRTRAKLLFVHDGFLDTDYTAMLASAAEDNDPVGTLAHLAHTVDIGSSGPTSWPSFLDAAGDTARATAEEMSRATDPNDVLDIIFTSGTTGRPKGAMSAHRQTISVAQVWADQAEVVADDRYLIINPFFHTFGYKAGFLVCLLRGATVIPMAVFDLDAVLDGVDRERVTILPGPPTLYLSMLERTDRDRYDLTSLRLAVTGTTVVPVALIEQMRRELSFSTVLTAYGLSEAVVVTMCRPGDDPETVSHTSGTAVAGFEVRVVDRDGEAVPAGISGEIQVRGANVMLGYFEDPEATSAAIDAGGWLHTGDLGQLDDRGYLTITDRIKDMFTVGGFNVYPAEVEQILNRHEAVLECAVVGAPDDRMGEVGVAFVVLRAGQAPSTDELVAFCRERLANFKVPRRVEIVTQIPRNAAGKILKKDLRDHVRTSPSANSEILDS